MISTRIIIALLGALSLAAGSSLAQGRGGGALQGGAHPPSGGGAPGGARPPGGGYYRGGGYYHGGGHYYAGYRPYYPFWGGVGLGIGLGYWGWPYSGYYYGAPYYYGPPVLVNPGEGAATAPLPQAPPAGASEPIFYPRNGQSDEQKEVDLRECNRWATTQPSAMADARIFMRATFACMDGRGYTGR